MKRSWFVLLLIPVVLFAASSVNETEVVHDEDVEQPKMKKVRSSKIRYKSGKRGVKETSRMEIQEARQNSGRPQVVYRNETLSQIADEIQADAGEEIPSLQKGKRSATQRFRYLPKRREVSKK
jgi:hypothetical protein